MIIREKLNRRKNPAAGKQNLAEIENDSFLNSQRLTIYSSYFVGI